MARASESRRPLGLAVVGGLMFSQVITLYLTPVFYTYMESFEEWLNRTFRRGQQAEAIEAAPTPALAHD